MIKAIRDAGFTPVPDDVGLTVTGTLEHREGALALALDQMQEPRTVTCVGTPAGGALEKELAQNAGRRMEIRGLWQFGGSGRLQVEKFEVIPAAP